MTLVRLLQAVRFYRIRLIQLTAAFRTRPCGNLRNRRDAKNSRLDAPRPITAMEIVTLLAIPSTPGSSMLTWRNLPTLPAARNELWHKKRGSLSEGCLFRNFDSALLDLAEATVDSDFRTGHERSIGRRQEGNSAGNFRRLPDALHGNL